MDELKLFLAGGEGGWSARWTKIVGPLPEMPYEIMTSFIKWDDNETHLRMQWAHEHGKLTFLDSGAFSALTKNVVIDLDDYIRFCEERRRYFDFIAVLDVIHDPEASLKNWEVMKKSGFPDAVPCFHIGEPWEFLHEMKDAPVVGLGVAAMQRRGQPVEAWIGECFQRLKDWGSTAKVHGYAITSFDWMWRFPWSSVDSSSWFMGARYGSMAWLEGRRIVMYNRMKPPRDLRTMKVWRQVMPPARGSMEQYFPLLRNNITTYARACELINLSRKAGAA